MKIRNNIVETVHIDLTEEFSSNYTGVTGEVDESYLRLSFIFPSIL